MAILDFLKVSKKAPAAAIDEMETSLARLRAEMKEASVVVESHGTRRAAMLLSAATEQEIVDADKSAELAALKLERLELAEMALLEQIEAARDSDARQRRAGEMDSAVAAISAKTAAVDAAAAAFASACKDLLAVIPGGLVDIQIRSPRHTQPVKASPTDIASAIAGQALSVAAPQLFQDRPPQLRHWGSAVERVLAVHDVDAGGNLSPVLAGECGQDASITTADNAARRVILEPLRRVAEEIRQGKVASDAKRPAPRPATIEPKLPPLVPCYILKPLRYTDFRGVLDNVEPGENNLPEPVYERAIALELAVERGDERAQEHRSASRRRPQVDMRYQTHLKPEPPIDTGVDIKRLLDTERARLNQHLEAAE